MLQDWTTEPTPTSTDEYMIRPLEPADLPRVADVYRRAHPGWPDKAPIWWLANPTLVCVVYDGDREVIAGHTSCMVDTLAGVAQYRDVCVDPAYAGRGIGRQLTEAREEFCREAGCTMFVGGTWDGNVPMVKIFEALGYHRCQKLPGHFAYNDPPADGWVWVKSTR